MTPFQILLITLTIAIFGGWFSYSTKKESPETSKAFAVISGFAMLAVPILIGWCILHYIKL